MKRVIKYVTPSVHHEVNDFYGAGSDEVITSMEKQSDTLLVIITSAGQYHIGLKPKDYLVFEDGTWEIIKNPFDKEDI